MFLLLPNGRKHTAIREKKTVTRSKCKHCASSGTIKAAVKGGRYILRAYVDRKFATGMVNRIAINLLPGQSAKCPFCHPDKYMPTGKRKAMHG